ncbi:MAG: hypothetical protein VKN56_05870 [Cyanobacteriota bacterium]|nr:hypothetical protein [Cyanobacteriota bacterium]
MSLPRFSLPCAVLVLTAALGSVSQPARASGLGSIVQAYCLAAFQQEMAQAGKVAPEGMAAYACRCVVDRITAGTSLPSARSFCRDSTARRYAL